MKIPILVILFLCFTILFGCSTEKIQGLPISQKAIEIRKLVNQSQWKKAEQEVALIQELYKSNKWRYQILGDKIEYHNLNIHIKKLKVALEEKDKTEAKLNIVMIENYIESLYFR
ncbi:protein of unknown function [Virgibacillus subterraneus]|uniref:Uncharacterized protein n=2 Tax=Virgibacillus TaxID=84406 RepID=A0A1H1CSZ1_9BACI|nr:MULTISPECIES: DUF4363 family protein [Virgibacillus]SDQ67375.1 protein of unknown function [Virgibacillus salinus]SEQ65671.1 protein of unknown function [Virgibacillus subterraneus]